MPSRLIAILLFLFQIYAAAGAFEAPFAVRHVDTATSLSNTKINAVCKDSRGFMWIGTSSGLFRYDGYEVSAFQEAGKDVVLNSYVEDIQEDGDGRLWVLSDSKWMIYDPATGEVIPDAAELLQEKGMEGNISTIYTGKDGKVYAGAYGKGVYYLTKEEKLGLVPMPPGVKGRISDIAGTDKWIACVTECGDLFFFDPRTMKVTRVAGLPSGEGVEPRQSFVYIAYADKSGRIWIFNNERLMLYDTATGEWLNDKLPGGGYAGIIKNIYNDSKGRLWIARDHHGLERIVHNADGFEFVGTQIMGALTPNNTVICFSEDAGGTLWLGTYKQGLFYHNEAVRKFGMENFPDANCVVSAGGNSMWVGTDSSGLWKWNLDTGAREHIGRMGGGEYSPAITSMAVAPDGTLYIGSFSRGLRRLHNGVISDVKTGTDLDSSYPWALAFDRDGNLWTGTLGGGVYRTNIATGETTSYKVSDSGLSDDYILSAISSRDGKMYFATSCGLSVYNPAIGKIESYLGRKEGEAVKPLSINQVYEDSRGLLWLGTRSGLEVIDRQRKKRSRVSLGEGRENPFILGVIEDNGGAMWVAEGSNLVNLKVAYDDKTGSLSVSPRVYDNRDGVQNCELNQRSFAKLPTGEIVVGGLYGLNRFSPADIKFNTEHPRVMFTDLYMSNRRIRIGEEVDGRVVMKNGLNSGKAIELDHNPKEFTIYFASDNYVLPEKTVFQYRLEGYNDKWLSCPEGVNHVTYTNLSPGHYTLQVRAVNGDGYESEAPAELPIVVHYPFWATPLAYGVYALLGALMIYAIVRVVRAGERRRFEKRRKEDALRKQEEISQLKFKFFTNVSHDLRTPLTLIVSPLEAMLKETSDEKQTKRLRLMYSNAMRLLGLVNQLLDFRKIEMAGLRLNPSEGDIVDFSRNVCNSFLGLSERKNIRFSFHSDHERIEMMFDEDKMEKILMNLLGNAFKFTPAGGRVDVSLECPDADGSRLRIKVADTGPGVKDADKERIFERFYQVDAEGEAHPGMGSGIGLSMAKEYVKLHEGTIKVADNVEEGSVFIIDIPVRHIDAKGAAALVAKATEPRSAGESLAGAEEEAYKAPSGEPKGSKPVVLAVDDNPDMAELIRDGLDDDFDVVTAADGIEALERLGTLRPDIIIADLMMPRMGGIDLCRKLKGNAATASIPIIILTAKHDLGVKVEGLTLGADDYITKPFNFDVLRLRIKRLVELTGRGARRGLIDPEPESIKITPLDEKFIGKAVEYVTANLDSSDLSVEELSAHLGMSRVRLYKKIKQITGKTPIGFIRVIRLKRAAQMLRESQLNVSEIAYQTGFNNPKVFSKYFKEEFGILPSLYQNREGKETNYTV